MHIKNKLLYISIPKYMQSVDSAQNKELLWSTLQESGAFAGLTRDQFQPVQSAFDRSVQQAAAKSGAAVSLSDVNKHIIREFMQVLRAFQKPPPVPVPEKKKQIGVSLPIRGQTKRACQRV